MPPAPGKWFPSWASEFQVQFQEAMREAEMADLKKQAEDLKNSVSDLANINPMADTQKEIERAFDIPEPGKATEAPAEASPATPSALPEPAQQVDLNVPFPEPPSPPWRVERPPSVRSLWRRRPL